MFKALLRPAMIFIPFALGVMFPQAHVLNDPPISMVRWVLICMIFISCLQINLNQLKPKKEHWYLLAANLFMGLVPYGIIRLAWPENEELAKAAFFVGITPTATAAPVVIAFLNGRIGFALTGFTITNIFISLSLLLLLPMVTGNFTINFIGNVAVTLLMLIALPAAMAAIVRKIYPKAKEWPKKCKTFTFSLWSLVLFILAAVAREYFIEHPSEFSIWKISRTQALPSGMQPAAGAEKYHFYYVSGPAVCRSTGGHGTDFLYPVAQYLECIPDVSI